MALLPRYPSTPISSLGPAPVYYGPAGSDASLGGIAGHGRTPMPGALMAPSLAALTGTGGVGTDSLSDRAYGQQMAGEQRANDEWSRRQQTQQEAQIASEGRGVAAMNAQKLTPMQQVQAQIERDRVANNARIADADSQRAADQKAGQAGKMDNFEATLASQRAAAARAADLAARQKANEENQSRMVSLTQQMSSQGGPAAAIPAAVSRTGGPNAAMEQAARAAAFSRAKDQAGALTRASLNSLAGEMSGRGVSGSGEEAVRTAGAVGSGAGYLGDITREQMLADLGSATHNADMGYQGDITQRGQTISAQDAAAARAAQQRQSILSLLGSSGSVY